MQTHGPEGWQQALTIIASSHYLQGKNRRRSDPWKVTIDWLIEPENFAKVLEGNYSKNESLEDLRHASFMEELMAERLKEVPSFEPFDQAAFEERLAKKREAQTVRRAHPTSSGVLTASRSGR